MAAASADSGDDREHETTALGGIPKDQGQIHRRGLGDL